MDFLKRHYEKIILLGLLILFMLLMLGLLNINEKTHSVQESDLRLPRRQPDHQTMDPKDEQFDVRKLWKERAMHWLASSSRSGDAQFSDLVDIGEYAFCPYCTAQNREANTNVEQLIPASAFGAECPICAKKLPEPVRKTQAVRGYRTKNDLDGDGIPNDVEKKFHLDPENPDDALADLDGDGFSNFYEITKNTNPANAASHPPFWHRLYLADIKQVELPIRFMALNDNNSDDKKDWEIQYNTVRKGKVSSRIATLGETITIENREYQIEDLERIRQEITQDTRVATEGRQKRFIDKSRVTLVEVVETDADGKLLYAPDRLTMIVGQPVYSSDKRPLLADSGFPEKEPVQLKTGSKIRVSCRTGRYAYGEYVVDAIDAEKMSVTLHDAKARQREDGSYETLYTITKEGEIPPTSRVVPPDENRDNVGDVPPEFIPQEPKPQSRGRRAPVKR